MRVIGIFVLNRFSDILEDLANTVHGDRGISRRRITFPRTPPRPCHSLSGGLPWTCSNKYATAKRREDCKPSPSIQIPSGEQYKSNMPPPSSIWKVHFLLAALKARFKRLYGLPSERDWLAKEVCIPLYLRVCPACLSLRLCSS